jgi:hypothetical protein
MSNKQSSAAKVLRSLSADEIRQRLDEIESERKALRTLLRAAIQLERKRDRRGCSQ